MAVLLSPPRRHDPPRPLHTFRAAPRQACRRNQVPAGDQAFRAGSTHRYPTPSQQQAPPGRHLPAPDTPLNRTSPPPQLSHRARHPSRAAHAHQASPSRREIPGGLVISAPCEFKEAPSPAHLSRRHSSRRSELLRADFRAVDHRPPPPWKNSSSVSRRGVAAPPQCDALPVGRHPLRAAASLLAPTRAARLHDRCRRSTTRHSPARRIYPSPTNTDPCAAFAPSPRQATTNRGPPLLSRRAAANTAYTPPARTQTTTRHAPHPTKTRTCEHLTNSPTPPLSPSSPLPVHSPPAFSPPRRGAPPPTQEHQPPHPEPATLNQPPKANPQKQQAWPARPVHISSPTRNQAAPVPTMEHPTISRRDHHRRTAVDDSFTLLGGHLSRRRSPPGRRCAASRTTASGRRGAQPPQPIRGRTPWKKMDRHLFRAARRAGHHQHSSGTPHHFAPRHSANPRPAQQ